MPPKQAHAHARESKSIFAELGVTKPGSSTGSGSGSSTAAAPKPKPKPAPAPPKKEKEVPNAKEAKGKKGGSFGPSVREKEKEVAAKKGGKEKEGTPPTVVVPPKPKPAPVKEARGRKSDREPSVARDASTSSSALSEHSLPDDTELNDSESVPSKQRDKKEKEKSADTPKLSIARSRSSSPALRLPPSATSENPPSLPLPIPSTTTDRRRPASPIPFFTQSTLHPDTHHFLLSVLNLLHTRQGYLTTPTPFDLPFQPEFVFAPSGSWNGTVTLSTIESNLNAGRYKSMREFLSELGGLFSRLQSFLAHRLGLLHNVPADLVAGFGHYAWEKHSEGPKKESDKRRERSKLITWGKGAVSMEGEVIKFIDKNIIRDQQPLSTGTPGAAPVPAPAPASNSGPIRKTEEHSARGWSYIPEAESAANVEALAEYRDRAAARMLIWKKVEDAVRGKKRKEGEEQEEEEEAEKEEAKEGEKEEEEEEEEEEEQPLAARLTRGRRVLLAEEEAKSEAGKGEGKVEAAKEVKETVKEAVKEAAKEAPKESSKTEEMEIDTAPTKRRGRRTLIANPEPVVTAESAEEQTPEPTPAEQPKRRLGRPRKSASEKDLSSIAGDEKTEPETPKTPKTPLEEPEPRKPMETEEMIVDVAPRASASPPTVSAPEPEPVVESMAVEPILQTVGSPEHLAKRTRERRKDVESEDEGRRKRMRVEQVEEAPVFEPTTTEEPVPAPAPAPEIEVEQVEPVEAAVEPVVETAAVEAPIVPEPVVAEEPAAEEPPALAAPEPEPRPPAPAKPEPRSSADDVFVLAAEELPPSSQPEPKIAEEKEVVESPVPMEAEGEADVAMEEAEAVAEPALAPEGDQTIEQPMVEQPEEKEKEEMVVEPAEAPVDSQGGHVGLKTVPETQAPVETAVALPEETENISATKSIPAKTIPTKTVPTKTVPVEAVPTKTIPSEALPPSRPSTPLPPSNSVKSVPATGDAGSPQIQPQNRAQALATALRLKSHLQTGMLALLAVFQPGLKTVLDNPVGGELEIDLTAISEIEFRKVMDFLETGVPPVALPGVAVGVGIPVAVPVAAAPPPRDRKRDKKRKR